MKLITVALLFLLTIPDFAAPKPVNFELVDFAQSVVVNGINNAGDIVGAYGEGWPSNPVSFGFVRKAGQVINIGEAITPLAIDNQGRIVGYDALRKPFLYQNGQYTTITYPGAIGTFVSGISEGRIVGTAYDGSSTFGFLLDNGVVTRIDYPGAVYTSAHGISGNRIVGQYQDHEIPPISRLHGFVYEDGQYRTVDFPLFGLDDSLIGVTSKGTLLGSAEDTACTLMYFSVINGKTLKIDMPVLSITGINDDNLIVGNLGGRGFITKLSSFLQR